MTTKQPSDHELQNALTGKFYCVGLDGKIVVKCVNAAMEAFAERIEELLGNSEQLRSENAKLKSRVAKLEAVKEVCERLRNEEATDVPDYPYYHGLIYEALDAANEGEDGSEK